MGEEDTRIEPAAGAARSARSSVSASATLATSEQALATVSLLADTPWGGWQR